MDETIGVDFTQQEIIVLQNLIHLAVLARGMEVAEAGVVLTRKLKDAVDRAPKLAPEEYPRAAE